MLRAEGIAPYFAIWLWWHPLFWSGNFLVLGHAAGWVDSDSFIYGALGVGVCLAVKTATCVILNLGVYRQGAIDALGVESGQTCCIWVTPRPWRSHSWAEWAMQLSKLKLMLQPS